MQVKIIVCNNWKHPRIFLEIKQTWDFSSQEVEPGHTGDTIDAFTFHAVALDVVHTLSEMAGSCIPSYSAVLLTASAKGAPKIGRRVVAVSVTTGSGSALGFFFFFFSFHCFTTSAAVRSLDFLSLAFSSLGPFSFTLKSFSFFLEKLGFLKTWMPLERFILDGLSASSAELSSWNAAYPSAKERGDQKKTRDKEKRREEKRREEKFFQYLMLKRNRPINGCAKFTVPPSVSLKVRWDWNEQNEMRARERHWKLL